MAAFLYRSFLVLAVLVPGVGHGAVVQWTVESGGNGHYYEFVDQTMTWPLAKAAAESRTHLGLTGHLVTITSAPENEFVFNLLPATYYPIGAWIGLTDDETFGGFESFGQPNPQVNGWHWITGESFAFTDWGSFTNSMGQFVQEPNNMDNEDYVVLHAFSGPVEWNDQSAHYEPPFIVEYELAQAAVPEPATLLLWGAGVIGLAAMRRRQVA